MGWGRWITDTLFGDDTLPNWTNRRLPDVPSFQDVLVGGEFDLYGAWERGFTSFGRGLGGGAREAIEPIVDTASSTLLLIGGAAVVGVIVLNKTDSSVRRAVE